MGYPEKVYVAFQNGETKIEIYVSKMEGGYMAVMVPVASGDAQLRSLFKGHKIPQEIGTTIEFAIAACEMWIKENLGQEWLFLRRKSLERSDLTGATLARKKISNKALYCSFSFELGSVKT